MLEPMDVEPPSDLIVPRAPPPPRNVEFAVYPPGYGPSSNARRAANAEASASGVLISISSVGVTV